MVFFTAPLMNPVTETPTTFEVKSVQRHEAFAGRLGRRVVEVLTVEADGMTYNVQIGRYHTLMSEGKLIRVGDRLSIQGTKIGNTILAPRSQVRHL